MALITARVQALSETQSTPLLVREGCTVQELRQVLHHRGDPDKRPGKIFLRGESLDAAATISTGNVYKFCWVADASAPRVDGCAGIQVKGKYLAILPTMFTRGCLPVRFS